MIALCGVYVYSISAPIYYAAISAFAVNVAVICVVDGEKYPHVARSAFVIELFLAAAVGAYILFYTTGLNEKFNDFEALKSVIIAGGGWGFAVFIGLTVFQVVVLPLPAAVTILLGVAIYGPTVSFILSTVGTIIGSMISFALGKIFGRRLCNFMFGAEKTEKYARILNERGRFLFIIMLVFPAFPDDMLCMIAGITTMSYGYFFVVCALTRPIMIGLTAYLGSGIIPFSGWGIPVWVAIGCVLVAAFILIAKLKPRIEGDKKSKQSK